MLTNLVQEVFISDFMESIKNVYTVNIPIFNTYISGNVYYHGIL